MAWHERCDLLIANSFYSAVPWDKVRWRYLAAPYGFLLNGRSLCSVYELRYFNIADNEAEEEE